MGVIEILRLKAENDVEVENRKLTLEECRIALEERKIALQEKQFEVDKAECEGVLRNLANVTAFQTN